MLNDSQIRDRMKNLVRPWSESQLQPASYDVRLGDICWFPNLVNGAAVEVSKDKPLYTTYNLPFTLGPTQFALFSTLEQFDIPNDIAAKFEGKSSLGRIGLMTHITAGFIDPGFRGNLTLELCNVGPYQLILNPGIKIGQVQFTLIEPAERPYGTSGLGSHYQDSVGVRGYEV